MVVKLTTFDILKVFQKKANPENSSEPDRIWMSVKGDLLGIRKTDRYWLVHKNVFETRTIRGKMWVNIESFEKWYANQVKYRKVTGEESGLELKEWSLSPRDIAQLLEIPEYRVYDGKCFSHISAGGNNTWSAQKGALSDSEG